MVKSFSIFFLKAMIATKKTTTATDKEKKKHLCNLLCSRFSVAVTGQKEHLLTTATRQFYCKK
jgi:hypothetical protein